MLGPNTPGKRQIAATHHNRFLAFKLQLAASFVTVRKGLNTDEALYQRMVAHMAAAAVMSL
jgi:hypothetical protein